MMTGDESWCFLHDPQLQRQSTIWNSSRRNHDRSRGLFFDESGMVRMYFISEGASVRQAPPQGRSFAVYAIQFAVSVLTSAAGRTVWGPFNGKAVEPQK
jgi:hypothetical protein